MIFCISKGHLVYYLTLILGVTAVTGSAQLASDNSTESACIDTQTKEAQEFCTLETDLLTNLLDNGRYDARQRPVRSPNQTVQVNISLSVFVLTNVVEKEKKILTLSWLTLMWHDHRLTWDPAKYGNLQFLRLDSKDVWTPKVILQNTSPGEPVTPMPPSSSEILVMWDGTMYYEYVGGIQSLCPFNITRFPYDIQSCIFRFKLQTTPSSLCVLMGTGENDVILKKTRTFKLHDKLLVRNYIAPGHVKVPNLNFSYVEFILIMERLPSYYMYAVGFPATIITFLSMFSLLLPSNCGEKLSFPVSLFLGLSVLQLVIEDSLPEYDGTLPFLVAYLSMTFIMVGSTLFLSLITVTTNASRRKITNRRLRLFLLEVPSQLLCVNYSNRNKSTKLMADEFEGNVESNPVLTKPDKETTGNVEHKIDVIPPTEDQVTDMELLAKILDRIFFICLLTVYCIGISVLVTRYILTT